MIEWVVKSRVTGTILVGFDDRDKAVTHANGLNQQHQTDEYVAVVYKDKIDTA